MMMTFKAAELFGNFDPCYLSGSAAELGDNAGQMTWRNCMARAKDTTALFRAAGVNYDELKAHFRSYGAWDDEEIEGWSKAGLRAMAIQEMAADYRECTERGAEETRHYYNEDTDEILSYWGV